MVTLQISPDEDHESLPSHVIEGLRLFNQGKYFEAHEAFEIAWREESRPIRAVYQGLLQAAVTYLHLQRGNYRGACKVYERAMKRLEGWPAIWKGIDLATLRADLTQTIEHWNPEPDPPGETAPREFKPVRWTESGIFSNPTQR